MQMGDSSKQIKEIIKKLEYLEKKHTKTPEGMHRLKQALPYMNRWQLKTFVLENNEYHLIIPILSKIVFPQLKVLSLINLQIQSLQPISRLEAPQLEHLSFQKNKLSTIRGLRKIESRRLRNLSIQMNKILEGGEIIQGNWQFLRFVEIEFYGNWLCKLDKGLSKQFSVWGRGRDRIHQSPLVKALTQKYSDLIETSINF